MINKKIKNKPSSKDTKIVKAILSNLSDYEIEFFFRFMRLHSDLSPSDKDDLLKSENPELFDKIKLIINEV